MKKWICGAFLLAAEIVKGQDSATEKLIGPKEAEDTVGRKLLQEVVQPMSKTAAFLKFGSRWCNTTAEWNRYSKMSIVPRKTVPWCENGRKITRKLPAEFPRHHAAFIILRTQRKSLPGWHYFY
jgi:hypothetical protein